MLNRTFCDFTNQHFSYFYKTCDKVNMPYLSKVKNDIKINNIKYKISSYKISLNKIKKLVDTFWVSKQVLNELDSIPDEYKISWTYKNIEHNIYIKTTKNQMDTFKYRINILLNMLNYMWDIKKTNAKNKYQIYLVLTNLTKHFPNKKNIPIGVNHINSGYTDFGTNEIFIWRLEEFEKLIFHEVIHYNKLDSDIIEFKPTINPHDIIGLKSYFEAFTDFWGIFYYLIYLSLITKKSVQSLFCLEYNFIKNQANFLNDFFNLGDWSNKKTIKQISPAFSYFVIKYCVFNNVINKGIDIIYNPKQLLIDIFTSKFPRNKFINANSARMTLLQLK